MHVFTFTGSRNHFPYFVQSVESLPCGKNARNRDAQDTSDNLRTGICAGGRVPTAAKTT